MTSKPLIDEQLCSKVIKMVDKGLTRGQGSPVPGQMCVEAAVCYAMGLPHSDSPPCVGPAVRSFKIKLNDSQIWPSDQARASGMRKLAIAQLGSDQIDQKEFSKYVVLETIKRILPLVLENGFGKEADECRKVTNLEEAKTASAAARDAVYATADAALCC